MAAKVAQVLVRILGRASLAGTAHGHGTLDLSYLSSNIYAEASELEELTIKLPRIGLCPFRFTPFYTCQMSHITKIYTSQRL